jgi:hypothetical protein
MYRSSHWSKGKIKGGSFAYFPLGPDLAAMAMDNTLDQGEADAGAWEFSFRVQALKGAEKFVGVGHVKTGAIVADKVG